MCVYIHEEMLCSSYLQELFLLAPSPKDYTSERLSARFVPLLDRIGMGESTSAPILHVFLRNMHHMLLDQYSHELVMIHNSVCNQGLRLFADFVWFSLDLFVCYSGEHLC